MNVVRRVLVGLLFATAVVTTGCVFVDYGSYTEVNLEGDFDTEGDAFRWNGSVRLGGTENYTYDDVVICFYDSDDQLLYRSEEFALDDTSLERSFDVTLDRSPKYIMIDAPRFWETSDDLSVDYRVRRHVQGTKTSFVEYVYNTAGSREELPVQGCAAGG